jgi:hypothetical protein
MEMASLEGAAGAVTAITGFEKGSGKTTFLNYALPLVRRSGPVAVFTIGVDGALKARDSAAPPPAIHVEAGDLVMTTDAFARAATARFEILEAIPGRSTLGKLFLGRAVRRGSVTLVGCEHLSVLADKITQVRQEGWATSVLVDGAVNRLTQVSALGELGFVFTVRIDRGNLHRAAARMQNLHRLAGLPVVVDPSADTLRIEGPLDPSRLTELAPEVRGISVEDFTKVFLEPAELARALQRLEFSVRRGFRLICFAVALRDVSRDELLRALGEPLQESLLFNPYEVAC